MKSLVEAAKLPPKAMETASLALLGRIMLAEVEL